MSPKYLVLLVGFFTEGFLTLLWFLGKESALITPTNKYYSLIDFILLSSALILPLLILNYLLFIRYPNQTRNDFLQTKVYPLCQILNIPSAIFISLIAGIGEELFFRDLLLNYLNISLGPFLAILLSSLAFALVHFIGQIKNSLPLILIYLVVGFYFAFIYLITQSVLICITIHFAYDLVAIMAYKFALKQKNNFTPA